MPLDIQIDDEKKGAHKLLSLHLGDYDLILKMIGGHQNFSILKRSLSDYYGEAEIYLNELENLKMEIEILQKLVETNSPETLKDFLSDFHELIVYAIANRKTIKFVGD